MKYITNGIILILSWVMLSQVAFGLADVKSSTMVTKSTVTLGDLLENLDAGHDIWVMNAPAPGQKTSVSTKYLATLTRQHDVYWQNSRGVRHITITRKGKTIKQSDLKHLIDREFAALNIKSQNIGIRFDNKNGALHIAEEATVEDVAIEDFSFDKRNGKFSAKITLPQGENNSLTTVLRGRTYEVSYVPTLKKNVLPGREITANDIGWTAMPSRNIGRNIIREKAQLIGMTPRRGLTPSNPLKLSDLERPKIIDRGEMVSILFKSGKISLTAIGKAIEKGGRGDVIRVMNSKSHKTIDAMVIGPNQVQIVTANNGLAQLSTLP